MAAFTLSLIGAAGGAAGTVAVTGRRVGFVSSLVVAPFAVVGFVEVAAILFELQFIFVFVVIPIVVLVFGQVIESESERYDALLAQLAMMDETDFHVVGITLLAGTQHG